MANSPLIPTPRVDKNGRTTIRHMKAEELQSSSQFPIPPVTLGTSEKETEDRDFLYSVYGDEPNYAPPSVYIEAVRLIRTECPSAFTTTRDLLARGNESGDASLREFLTDRLDLMALDIGEGDPKGALKGLRFSICGDMDEMLIRAWSIGTVRSEYSASDFDELTINDFIDGTEEIRLMLCPDSYPVKNTSTAYWRGMAAAYYLEFAISPEDKSKQDEVIEFVNWAGEHPDIDSVIRIAKERGTTNVQAIESTLDNMNDVAPSVREGVL